MANLSDEMHHEVAHNVESCVAPLKAIGIGTASPLFELPVALAQIKPFDQTGIIQKIHNVSEIHAVPLNVQPVFSLIPFKL
jgi:hypothetical protein